MKTSIILFWALLFLVKPGKEITTNTDQRNMALFTSRLQNTVAPTMIKRKISRDQLQEIIEQMLDKIIMDLKRVYALEQRSRALG